MDGAFLSYISIQINFYVCCTLIILIFIRFVVINIDKRAFYSIIYNFFKSPRSNEHQWLCIHFNCLFCHFGIIEVPSIKFPETSVCLICNLCIFRYWLNLNRLTFIVFVWIFRGFILRDCFWIFSIFNIVCIFISEAIGNCSLVCNIALCLCWILNGCICSDLRICNRQTVAVSNLCIDI